MPFSKLEIFRVDWSLILPHRKWIRKGLLAFVIFSCLSSSSQGTYSCSVSTLPLNYGNYSPFAGASTDGAGTVTVTCSPLILAALLVSYTISLSQGSSGTYAQRTMGNGPVTLGYNLYTNSLRTTVWGNGTAGTSVVPDSYTLQLLTPRTINYTVYGRIPAGQTNVVAGAYTDTVIVTVTY